MEYVFHLKNAFQKIIDFCKYRFKSFKTPTIMKYFLSTLLLFCVSVWQVVFAQTSSIDRVQFLNDTSTLNATIIINAAKLFSRNKRGSILTAKFVTQLPDGTNVNDQIQLEVRGHFRHNYCYLPPLKLIFKYKKPSILYSLKSLKLVNQ